MKSTLSHTADIKKGATRRVAPVFYQQNYTEFETTDAPAAYFDGVFIAPTA